MPLKSKQKQDRVGGPGASHENRKHPERSQLRGPAPEERPRAPSIRARRAAAANPTGITATIQEAKRVPSARLTKTVSRPSPTARAA
jgi:hypothetical protein